MAGDAQAADVIAALERRFNPPSRPREWATFSEVTDEGQHRRIDWLCAHLWLNRGRLMHGVEVKVRRADWLKEIRAPKADSWFSVVDYWWLAAPQGVVEDGELPATWGFLELRRHRDGWKLFEKVPAPQLPRDTNTPWWLVQRMLARVEDARKAPPVTPEALKEARSEGSREGYEHGKASAEHIERIARTSQRELQELRHAIGQRPIEQIRRAIAILDKGRVAWAGEEAIRQFRRAADQIEIALRDGAPPPDDDAIRF
jgi:hypothetical protein